MILPNADPKIILMLGDDGALVVPSGLGKESPFFVPLEETSGTQDILDFIARYPNASLTLFADNLAQDYRRDDIPPLHVFDRKKLIARRLAQTFATARLTSYLYSKELPSQVLLIGLQENNPVFAWAERLRDRMPVIALLPVEGAPLVKRLMPNAEWALMISRQKTGGYRQIVTYKNNLVFTRLTPLPSSNDAEDEGGILARDVKASLDYLARLGLDDPKGLSVLILSTEPLDKTQALQNLPLKELRLLSPFAAARKLNLSLGPWENDPTSDLLFAAALIDKKSPALPLRLPEAQKAWQTETLKKNGTLIGYFILLAVVTLTLGRALDLAFTLYQTQNEIIQYAKTKYALSQAQTNAAPLTEPLGRMRQALVRRHIFEQPAPTPWAALSRLSENQREDAKIVGLSWTQNAPGSPERLTLTLRMQLSDDRTDRADTVSAFAKAAQSLAQALPDYVLTAMKPPYPALPDERVSSEQKRDADPLGVLTLERKTP